MEGHNRADSTAQIRYGLYITVKSCLLFKVRVLEGTGRKAKGIYILKILFWPLVESGLWIVRASRSREGASLSQFCRKRLILGDFSKVMPSGRSQEVLSEFNPLSLTLKARMCGHRESGPLCPGKKSRRFGVNIAVRVLALLPTRSELGEVTWFSVSINL